MPWLFGLLDVPMNTITPESPPGVGAASRAEDGETNAVMSARDTPTIAATPRLFRAIRSSRCSFRTRADDTRWSQRPRIRRLAELRSRHRGAVGVDEPEGRVLPLLRVVHANAARADDAGGF